MEPTTATENTAEQRQSTGQNEQALNNLCRVIVERGNAPLRVGRCLS